jgi:squalene-hopene/tetraprenyl-beta-curcumene cyclase
MTVQSRAVMSCVLALAGVAVGGSQPSAEPSPPGFDARAAAAYLDKRADWWASWPSAARDRGTFCISCHTTLPYALARPLLRAPLGEHEPGVAESKILDNLLTRARSWRDVEPFYPDQTRGIPKTSESRAIEAVMNAAVLARLDARAGRLSDDTRTAFDVMWALQMQTGPNEGAWTWLDFNYEPWESPSSPYFGAATAALAVGWAPEGYAASAAIQDRLQALRSYFQRQHAAVSLLNQLHGLWASGGIPNLLTSEQRTATIDAAFALQQADGGWSTSSLGAYRRVDKTPNDTRTDGYATALATLALQAAGVDRDEPRVAKGLDWLRAHQDRATGRWIAASLNKEREPESDRGLFMSDAATAYAVLALAYEAR